MHTYIGESSPSSVEVCGLLQGNWRCENRSYCTCLRRFEDEKGPFRPGGEYRIGKGFQSVCVCMYVCMYVRMKCKKIYSMYVWLYVCLYVCMYYVYLRMVILI